MNFGGWKPYVRAADRRRRAESAAAKAKKAGATLAPIAPSRGAIAKTFWGKAWCDNLERYSDFANRLPRARTYVRNGSVIDLAIGQGEVRAQVMGSRLYRVDVRVAAVGDRHWKAIGADCAGSIDSMVELLQGRFSKAVMQRLCRLGDGLFPTSKEIQFTCSCPDWASMCKHVAAVLYGVGARLDQQPELLFKLRRVDGNDLLAQLMLPAKRPVKASVLDESALEDVFGIEMAQVTTLRDSVRAVAGQGKKNSVRAMKAASEVAAEAITKSSTSASKGDAKLKTAVRAPSGRAARTPKTAPGSRRQGANKENLPQLVSPTAQDARSPDGGGCQAEAEAQVAGMIQAGPFVPS